VTQYAPSGMDTSSIDFVIELGGGTYKPYKASSNGPSLNGGLLNINLACGHSVNLTLYFTLSGQDEPLLIPGTQLVVTDFDYGTGGQAHGVESMQLLNSKAFPSVAGSLVAASPLTDGTGENFVATVPGVLADNPTSLGAMTTLQQEKSVFFNFTTSAAMDFNFTVSPGSSGRNLLFGACILSVVA
jgi:hypothetical protein